MHQFGQSISAHAPQKDNNRCLIILFDRSSVWINAHFYAVWTMAFKNTNCFPIPKERDYQTKKLRLMLLRPAPRTMGLGPVVYDCERVTYDYYHGTISQYTIYRNP